MLVIKAIILNSGVGSRIQELEGFKHKSLIEISGETLLGNQLKNLKDLGVSSFIITTGYNSNYIEEYVEKSFNDYDIEFVYNPKYMNTNYIYSLYLAKDLIDTDAILIHGDILLESEVLKMLMSSEGNVVTVNKDKSIDHNDFKGRIDKGKIVEIGVKLKGESVYSLEPVYKLSKKFMNSWLDKIEEYIKEGNSKVYAENALNELLGDLKLFPVDVFEYICMEIDTLEDLYKAKNRLMKEF